VMDPEFLQKLLNSKQSYETFQQHP
jgi:hypothetical protein